MLIQIHYLDILHKLLALNANLDLTTSFRKQRI